MYYCESDETIVLVKTKKEEEVKNILSDFGFEKYQIYSQIDDCISKNNFQDYLLDKMSYFAECMGYKFKTLGVSTFTDRVDNLKDESIESQATSISFSLDGVEFYFEVQVASSIILFQLGYATYENGDFREEEYYGFDPISRKDCFESFKTITSKHLSTKVEVYDPNIRFAYSLKGQKLLKDIINLQKQEDGSFDDSKIDDIPDYAFPLFYNNGENFDESAFNLAQFSEGQKQINFEFTGKKYSGNIFESEYLESQLDANSEEALGLYFVVDPNDVEDCSYIVYLEPTEDNFEEVRDFFNKIAKLNVVSPDYCGKGAIYDSKYRRVGSLRL